MQVRIGTWCGGCSGEAQGTIQWAGGPTTFGDAPYVMTITSLEVDNANPAGSYIYSDMSGSASSIQGGGAIPLPDGSSTSHLTDKPAAISSSTNSASSIKTFTSTSVARSTTSTSLTTANPNVPNDVSQPSVTTINVGPTSNQLQINSEASRFSSFSGIAALVFGVFLLLTQW